MVIYIIFNTHNRTPDRFTKEWIEYRIDIFERYTLQSIKEQTNQDFRVYLCCEKITMPIIHECLAKREPLPDNVRFDTIPNNNKDILKYIEKYDYLYHIRLDSDNLYQKDFIQKLYDYRPKEDTEVIISQNGYVYDTRDACLASYFQKSPPFYAFIYKVQEYKNGFRYNTPGGHRMVIKLWKYELLDGANYMITLHGKNELNNRNLLDEKMLLEKDEKEKVLKEFGILDRLTLMK